MIVEKLLEGPQSLGIVGIGSFAGELISSADSTVFLRPQTLTAGQGFQWVLDWIERNMAVRISQAFHRLDWLASDSAVFDEVFTKEPTIVVLAVFEQFRGASSNGLTLAGNSFFLFDAVEHGDSIVRVELSNRGLCTPSLGCFAFLSCCSGFWLGHQKFLQCRQRL